MLQELLGLYEDYSDVFRTGSSCAPGSRWVNSYSNNVYWREQLRKQYDSTNRSARGGGYALGPCSHSLW